MFETILLAVDGSSHSSKAVTVAIDIARKSQGEVVVFHAREHELARGVDWDHESRAEAQKVVDAACAEIATSGVRARTVVERTLVGRIAQAILGAAQEQKADLIVMGSRGHSDLAGLLLGSVAHKVIQLAHQPVLVAR